ncbi:guanine nucleotide-binding protein-like 1 isoform X2 [Zootermopsis nevadensis]|uniref:guanine nucleotide-binding protein-like 1 isoform X2 n=1 Tax=Zootermopsis nevadensis TaxID=136037 RepID=UPI000B8EC7A3|nr:guanine nucleotide-binding protein-like 1 isoform X2 [Zootermopsis nevadensis]
MPQGRRKVPFSGKAKKAQLKGKKQQKTPLVVTSERIPSKKVTDGSEYRGSSDIINLNQQPVTRHSRANPNRYAFQFHCETEAEICERKEEARKSIIPVPASGLEVVIEDFFLKELDFPKRPAWNFAMSIDELEAGEHKYFREYVSELKKKFSWKELSYFELNLETWRQLWRVLEMSDIVLVIVDIRFCALMFPPSVYNYVTEILHKDMILVLNKIDLAPAPVVVAWKYYFKEKYPALHILTFTSFTVYNLRGNQENKAGLQIRRRRGKLRMAAEGAKMLLEACKSIVNSEVDLGSWQKKISEEMELGFDDEYVEVGETIEMKKVDTSYVQHEKYRDGTLTIGCIGQPNVGKSSLMNAIMGKKVVSVSRTPGHTKYFQTIYLTPNVRLCDCPGLVFPSKVPKTVQVLMGSFPIAQLREPFSAVQYLAERIDLPNLLKLQHPDQDDEWSAMDICDGWALNRGFYTARAARLDSYRAANSLLRMALDGKICLCLYPPEYSNKKGFWDKHKDVQLVHWIQGKTGEQQAAAAAADGETEFTSSASEEEEVNWKVQEAGVGRPRSSEDRRATEEGRNEAGDQLSYEDAKLETDSEPEDGDLKAVFGVCNKFSVLDTGD